MGISTDERLRFKRRTSHVPNVMHKLLKFIFSCKHLRPLNILKMNRVRLINFDVWINRRTYIIWVDLNRYYVRYMKRSTFELGLTDNCNLVPNLVPEYKVNRVWILAWVLERNNSVSIVMLSEYTILKHRAWVPSVNAAVNLRHCRSATYVKLLCTRNPERVFFFVIVLHPTFRTPI